MGIPKAVERGGAILAGGGAAQSSRLVYRDVYLPRNAAVARGYALLPSTWLLKNASPLFPFSPQVAGFITTLGSCSRLPGGRQSQGVIVTRRPVGALGNPVAPSPQRTSSVGRTVPFQSVESDV